MAKAIEAITSAEPKSGCIKNQEKRNDRYYSQLKSNRDAFKKRSLCFSCFMRTRAKRTIRNNFMNSEG